MAGVMAASMMTGVVSVYADADSKTLTVGFDAEYPPFGYKDDKGDYVGFDLDLAQEVCDNLGWELVSFASLTENPDYNTAFMNLDSGAADAIAVDIGVAKYQLSQREEGKYVILDEPIQSEKYGIGFKKGNDELKDTVWEEVLKLYDAGEVDKLAEKYEVADMLCIGDDEKSDDKKDDAAEDGASDADTAKEDTADTAKDAE